MHVVRCSGTGVGAPAINTIAKKMWRIYKTSCIMQMNDIIQQSENGNGESKH